MVMGSLIYLSIIDSAIKSQLNLLTAYYVPDT